MFGSQSDIVRGVLIEDRPDVEDDCDDDYFGSCSGEVTVKFRRFRIGHTPIVYSDIEFI